MPKMSPHRLVAACILAAFSLVAAAQSAYRWVDKDGSVHYSDQPPPPEIKKLERKTLGDNVVDTSDMPYELRRAAENFPVTLYTSDDCGDPCVLAKELLQRRKTPFTEKRLKTAEDVAAYKAATGFSDAYAPTLAVGRQSAEGYVESEWNGLLDAAGYPRAPK